MVPVRRAAAVTLVAIHLGLASSSEAQPYVRFAVPDSAIEGALRASGTEFENQWNVLLIAELRAGLAGADSAKRLRSLEGRIAAAEPHALGSKIADDALALRRRWSPEQRDRRVRAAVAESVATVARNARAFETADSLLEAALGDYRALGERRREAWVLGSRGAVAQLAGNLDRADTLYREALAARKLHGDARMVGNSLNDLGTVNYLLQRYSEAHAFLEEARAVREASGQVGPLSNTLNFLGLSLAALGRPDSARLCFEKALEITTSFPDSARTLPVLTNYGKLLVDLADPRAVPICERGLRLARLQGDRNQEGILEHNLGDYLRQLGRFSESAEHLEAAVILRESLGNDRLLVEDLNSLGGTWIDLGDPERARPPLERALALSESLGDSRLRSSNLVNLSYAARLDADTTGAEALAFKALEAAVAAADSGLVHDVSAALGGLALDRGNPVGAERWYLRAAGANAGLRAETRVADRISLATAWQRAGRLDSAETEHRQALALAEQAGAEQLVWIALGNLGDIAERRGDYATALSYYRDALGRIESMRSAQRAANPSIKLFARRLYMFEAVIHLLNTLASLHPDGGYAAEAYLWAERARARSLQDLLAARHPEVQAAPGVTLDEARSLVPPRAALLEYSVGDSSSSLWVIRRSGWKHFTLPPRRVLAARVRMLRRGLSRPEAATTRSTRNTQATLYQILVRPAEPMLDGVDALIVAPNDVLALIPFEALLVKETPDREPPAKDYLVGRFAIDYIPAVSTLVATQRDVKARPVIVALGDPRFYPDSAAQDRRSLAALPPLPNTTAEVAMLQGLGGGRRIIALTGEQASRERLLATPELGRAEIVHLATHGDVNDVEPERSGLWLAPDSGASAPGRITVDDVLGLRFAASQVTLSACETGLGRLEAGEGVIGLTRAFLAAGARNVLVSLWSVNDRSTAILMDRFYRGLLEKGLPCSRALALAKRSMLANAETRSPFYWAAFVNVGEGGPLTSTTRTAAGTRAPRP